MPNPRQGKWKVRETMPCHPGSLGRKNVLEKRKWDSFLGPGKTTLFGEGVAGPCGYYVARGIGRTADLGKEVKKSEKRRNPIGDEHFSPRCAAERRSIEKQ